MLCDKMKDKRDDFVDNLDKKINDVVKKAKSSTHERKIVNEIIKYVGKCFNEESNLWTNQQVLGMIEVFRGLCVKS